MPRAPFQVLVYPYRHSDKGLFEYALLKRADAGLWQGVAGGGEGEEKPLEAARRETWEESGISPAAEFIELDTVESIPVTEFKNSRIWGEGIYVIPQYCFGVSAQNIQITISPEHTEYGWFNYEAALALIPFDGNKTALWELNKRLLGRGPRG